MTKDLRYYSDTLGIIHNIDMCHMTDEFLDRILEVISFVKKSRKTFKTVTIDGTDHQIPIYILLLLLDDQRINAIKYYREITGDGLYDSKKTCEIIKDMLDRGLIDTQIQDYIADSVDI